MTITAVWAISSPANTHAGDGLTVSEPSGVDELVDRLAEPNAGLAALWHEQREAADPDTGMLDHDVVTAVSAGFGYLAYIDTDHDYAVLDGDPDSPPLHVDDVHFPAGSGVGVDVLTEALREFLSTARRPIAVEWREVDPD